VQQLCPLNVPEALARLAEARHGDEPYVVPGNAGKPPLREQSKLAPGIRVATALAACERVRRSERGHRGVAIGKLLQLWPHLLEATLRPAHSHDLCSGLYGDRRVAQGCAEPTSFGRQSLRVVEGAFEGDAARLLKRHVCLRPRVMGRGGQPLERRQRGIRPRKVVELQQVADLTHARRQLELQLGARLGQLEQLKRRRDAFLRAVRRRHRALPVGEGIRKRRSIAEPPRHRDRLFCHLQATFDLRRPVQRDAEPRQQPYPQIGLARAEHGEGLIEEAHELVVDDPRRQGERAEVERRAGEEIGSIDRGGAGGGRP
jgi:hypothetical protein